MTTTDITWTQNTRDGYTYAAHTTIAGITIQIAHLPNGHGQGFAHDKAFRRTIGATYTTTAEIDAWAARLIERILAGPVDLMPHAA